MRGADTRRGVPRAALQDEHERDRPVLFTREDNGKLGDPQAAVG